MRQLRIAKSITNRTNSLAIYFNEISRHEPITQEEEVQLSQRIKKGDERALERLINANLRFVVSVAKQYQFRGIDLLDLINEGNLGLIRAARHFDETRGFKFISYAVWWIRQSIMVAVSNQADLIRLPLNKQAELRKIKAATSRLEQEYEREPTAEEIQEAVKGLKEVFDNTRIHSLDLPFEADETATLKDVMADPSSPSPDAHSMRESQRANIDLVLSKLKPREAEIIKMFYGIGCEEATLEEIGRRFDCSRERIRQLKDKALKKMRVFKDLYHNFIC